MFGSRLDLYLPRGASSPDVARRRSGARGLGDHRGAIRMSGSIARDSGARAGVTSRLHRGVYLLPNLITTCGLFAGFYSDHLDDRRPRIELAAVCILHRARLRRARRPHRPADRTVEPLRHRVRFALRSGRVRRRPGHPGLQVGARALGNVGLACGLALRRMRRAPPRALQRAGRVGREAELRRAADPGGRRHGCLDGTAVLFLRRRRRDAQARHPASW